MLCSAESLMHKRGWAEGKSVVGSSSLQLPVEAACAWHALCCEGARQPLTISQSFSPLSPSPPFITYGARSPQSIIFGEFYRG